jgi:hypothetical protein
VSNDVIINHINEIAAMSDDEQKQVYMVLDALIRDYKTKKACSK